MSKKTRTSLSTEVIQCRTGWTRSQRGKRRLLFSLTLIVVDYSVDSRCLFERKGYLREIISLCNVVFKKREREREHYHCSFPHVGNPFYSLYQFECTSLATKNLSPACCLLLLMECYSSNTGTAGKKNRSFGVTQNCSQREMKIQFGHRRRREHWIKKRAACVFSLMR